MTTENYNYRSKHGYDPLAPTTIEFVKYAITMRVHDPRAFVINVALATHYAGASTTSVIRPSAELIMHQTLLNDFELADAYAHLVRDGYWKIVFGADAAYNDEETEHDFQSMSHQAVRDYLLYRGIHAIDRFIPTFVDEVRALKNILREMPGSLNHIRMTVRYMRMKAGLATAMLLKMLVRIQSRYNDLGFRAFGKTPFNYQDGKIIHQTLFSHPMLKASTLEEVRELASVRVLTDDMVDSPFKARLSFADIAGMFDLGATPATQITKAISAIRRAGFFTADVETTRGNDDFKLVIIFTPTKKTHDLVWDYDFYRGNAQHQWETTHGHHPDVKPVEGGDPYRNYPPLGYHYIYLLKSKKGQYLSVGQTAKPLVARLRRHQVHGTTKRLESLIRKVNSDPEDALEIVYVGLVHFDYVAEYEMRTLWRMQELGHDVVNDVDDILQNLDTVRLSTRFDRYSPKGKKYVLRKALEKYGPVAELLPLPGETESAVGKSERLAC
jgi:hypothetical protein